MPGLGCDLFWKKNKLNLYLSSSESKFPIPRSPHKKPTWDLTTRLCRCRLWVGLFTVNIRQVFNYTHQPYVQTYHLQSKQSAWLDNQRNTSSFIGKWGMHLNKFNHVFYYCKVFGVIFWWMVAKGYAVWLPSCNATILFFQCTYMVFFWTVLSFLRVNSPTNYNSVIYYSSSCCSNPVSPSEHILRYFLLKSKSFLTLHKQQIN